MGTDKVCILFVICNIKQKKLEFLSSHDGFVKF